MYDRRSSVAGTGTTFVPTNFENFDDTRKIKMMTTIMAQKKI